MAAVKKSVLSLICVLSGLIFASQINAHGGLPKGVPQGFDTSAELRTLLTDEAGTGAATFGGVESVLYQVTKTLSATGAGADGAIVGSGAGALNHAAGVTLVAAETGVLLLPYQLIVKYTYATAAYAGGGNVNVYWNNAALSANLYTSNIFTDTGSNMMVSMAANQAVLEQTSNTPDDLVGKALILRSTAAYTNAGGATGTASVTLLYRKITLP